MTMTFTEALYLISVGMYLPPRSSNPNNTHSSQCDYDEPTREEIQRARDELADAIDHDRQLEEE